MSIQPLPESSRFNTSEARQKAADFIGDKNIKYLDSEVIFKSLKDYQKKLENSLKSPNLKGEQLGKS